MAFIITLSFLFTKLISEADLELKYYHRKILQSFGANHMCIIKYLIFTDTSELINQDRKIILWEISLPLPNTWIGDQQNFCYTYKSFI